MALAYSNLTGSSATNALKKKLSTATSVGSGSSALSLSGVGKPSVGITNQNLIPTAVKSTATTAQKSTPVKSTAAPAVSTASKISSTDDQLASLYAQLAEKQQQLAATQAAEAASKNTKSTKKAKEPEAPPTYGGLVGDLTKLAKTGSKDVTKAREYAEDVNRELRETKGLLADRSAAIKSAPTSFRVMQGRDQALALAGEQRLAALGSEFQGATNLQTNALTGQGQQLSALQGAAGLAAPVQVAPGSTLASPISGETVAGGLGGYANYQTAEQVMSLIRQYPDAGYVYDQAKTPQENLMAFQSGALQNSPTYQKGLYGVPGAQTIAGAATTQAAQQGYNTSYQLYQDMNTQLQNADGQAELLLQAVKSSGINASDARFANKTVNEIRRQLSSADLQVFDSALKATQAAYGNLLIAGGGTIPSESTAAYNIILNPNASLSAFEAALNQLKREGQVKLNAQGQQVNTYFNQLQSAPQGGPTTSSTSGGGNVFAEAW